MNPKLDTFFFMNPKTEFSPNAAKTCLFLHQGLESTKVESFFMKHFQFRILFPSPKVMTSSILNFKMSPLGWVGVRCRRPLLDPVARKCHTAPPFRFLPILGFWPQHINCNSTSFIFFFSIILVES